MTALTADSDSRMKNLNTKPAGQEAVEIRVARDPCAAMLQGHGRVLGVGHQFSVCGRGRTQNFDQPPMPIFRIRHHAVGQSRKRIYDRDCLVKRRRAGLKRTVCDYAHESRSNQGGKSEGLGAIGQPLHPSSVEIMVGILAAVGIDEDVDIRHPHRCQRPSSRKSAI